jgi:hypothetical protein
MSASSSLTPKLLKGALVKLGEGSLGPVPSVIVFQYNPETIKRELTSSGEDAGISGKGGGRWGKPTIAAPFDPAEKLTFTIELDAADELEFPESHPVTVLSGIADRIAALEMLLYPIGDSLMGKALSFIPGIGDAVPKGKVPVVLFVWGPGRIVPVRLISFSVDEEAFSTRLYPINAKVSIGLQVLTPESFNTVDEKLSISEQIAITAYKITRGQKELLAQTNALNSAESILAMLPF